MMAQASPARPVFRCSICDEPSLRICFSCTKDTCENHMCLKCRRCSDCCACEVPLEEHLPEVAAAFAEPDLAGAVELSSSGTVVQVSEEAPAEVEPPVAQPLADVNAVEPVADLPPADRPPAS